MLDEEMDDIIRESADKHHPPYNDKAWEKMEAKLNKHLPQKKDRKRFIFFLLLFLLLGTGAVFTATQWSGNKRDKSVAGKYNLPDNKHETVLVKPVPGNDEPGNTSTVIQQNGDKLTEKVSSVKPKPGNDLSNIANDSGEFTTEPKNRSKNKKYSFTGNAKSNISISAAKPADESEIYNVGKVKNKKSIEKNSKGKTTIAITSPDTGNDNAADESLTIIPAENTKEDILVNKENKKIELVKDKNNKEEKSLEPVAKAASSPGKKKSKKNFVSNFGLTFSAGPDLSFISLNKPGKATLSYGAGISYDVSKRITLRTGFYSVKKIYTATPEQYHNTIRPNLSRIEADCKVYEIPVSITYNFSQKNKHNWFGSLGLSTFLMKNEYYDYQYKTPAGQSYNYPYEISNENKHYFAVLNLSGGYRYNFNKRVSLQAEPYVKIPLSGIGLGKIKLNSSGILFTFTVKPFAKRK